MKLRKMKTILFVVILSLFFFNCDVSGVNRSIHIGDGQTVSKGTSTVNGNVIVGDNCKILSKCSTVNGKIKVGTDCEVRSLTTVNAGVSVGDETEVDGKISTVNGSITCGENVKVEGRISTINGNVTCRKGVHIAGNVTTVNGTITLTKTVVKEDVKIHNGKVYLEDKSVVEGDIIVTRKKKFFNNYKTLTIRITGDSVVKGDVYVSDDDLKVEVFLSNGGRVEGKIQNAEVIKE
jgi:DUF4097 and DUF4098 domain-containing protein YvlB